MASPFLHVTLAVDELNGRGLFNTAHRECLPKKTKVMQFWLQKDYKAVPTHWNASVIR